MPAPKIAAPLTNTLRHDVYTEISPVGDLAGSAVGLVVVVTGAGRGVGRAQAITFAQAGAKRVVIAARSTHELREVEEEIKRLGGTTEVTKVHVDVTDPASVERLFAQVPDVNVVINNAGILEPTLRVHEADPAEWWNTWDVNVKGTFLVTRAALRAALARPARPVELTVLNTSSLGSVTTRLGASSYQSGKSAINRFTEFVHFEYEDEGVRAFCYNPGGVDTKLARVGLPQSMHHFLVDAPELAAGFSLWLVTQGDRVDFLRGRYVNANWDVQELLARRTEIEAKGLLWTRTIGQEQVHADGVCR